MKGKAPTVVIYSSKQKSIHITYLLGAVLLDIIKNCDLVRQGDSSRYTPAESNFVSPVFVRVISHNLLFSGFHELPAGHPIIYKALIS